MSQAKTLAQKQLEGHPNPAALKPTFTATGAPAKPEHLSHEAAILWDFVVSELTKKNIAAAIDAPMLQQMCEYWGEYLLIKAQADQLTDHSTTDATRLLNNKNKASDCFRRIAREFGMTPQARNAVTAGNGSGDMVSKFLTGRGVK